LHTLTSSHTICNSLLASFPAPEKRERKKRRREKRKKKGITGIQGVLLLLPSQAMAEQDWTLPRLHRVTCKASRSKGS
jgi:hypothetical protein